ncbi:ferrous iron transporter B [Dethiobacter alkaliphilus]|uniref:ferrous iron transporter B n=1 Tax=Dethiobacter alkaliphilus TaxID=427926 RepID=UPI0022270F6A|nr:ferrous iron transporter B [Dethiobacter alkaliphilus]MCW3489434.1 ferrous iron transporter B [Dethiobacter alkaliphilus]
MRILLMGNPNVGKSVIFSKLTGREVLAANYAGTTVTYTQGKVNFKGQEAVLIDVPGTYSLEATSCAEEVAVDFLQQGAHVVMCVLDATNLERNLNLALQLQEFGLPVVFALNLVDVAERKGITIEVAALEKELGAPVIPTVAIRNVGLRELLEQAYGLAEACCAGEKKVAMTQGERWQEVGRIAENVQRVEHRHPTFWEKLGDQMIMPFPGLPIAVLVMAAALGVVVGGGKALRSLLLLPLINDLYMPFIYRVISGFVPEGMLRNVLVGEYGVLIKGIEWPFALILPYVFLFYIVLSFLEDSGYLPRLAVLVDGVLARIGIQGGNIIPIFMGYGCAVPAILGTRAATTFKERLIVTSLVSLAIPCVSQTAAFIALLGAQSALVLVLVYLISMGSIIFGGMILNRMIPGKTDPILLEVPNLLKPDRKALINKITIRTRHFLMEAEIPMLLGIGVAALVAETGFLAYVSVYAEPLVAGWLGLPGEITLSLILGIVRRELAVLPMLEMDLTTLQLLVGSVVALFYLPCISVLGVLVKEFGLKLAASISIATIVAALFFGGVINQVVSLFI